MYMSPVQLGNEERTEQTRNRLLRSRPLHNTYGHTTTRDNTYVLINIFKYFNKQLKYILNVWKILKVIKNYFYHVLLSF